MATKTKLKGEKDEIEKLQTHDSSLLIGKSYSINDESQNISTFQPILNTFTMPASFTDTIIQWGSQGLSNDKN